MRIFYAADTTPNSSFNSNIWRNNLLLPLIDLGHDVIEFDYDLRKTFRHLNINRKKDLTFIRKNRPKLSEELIGQIKKAHNKKPVDLFFSYFYDACVLSEAIEEIKLLGIKTVNWYCNGAHQFHLVKEIAPHYDWCLVPEKFRVNDYISIGARPIYSQEAANPKTYKPYDLPKEFDVTFIGQAYGERPAYIRKIIDAGIDIRVWGKKWIKYIDPKITLKNVFSKRIKYIFRNLTKKRMPVRLPIKIIGSILSDEELIKMYSRSKINLGFSSCNTNIHEERILQIRLRDFEVPMAGGFYLVEYMEELEEFFNIGKEIICYRNIEDLIDKIKYYLSKDSEREKIREAGHKRCVNEHTWQIRFKKAFQKMDLPD